MPEVIDFDQLSCPVPLSRYEHVLLGHGSGGRLTADLIERLFVPAFANRRPLRARGSSHHQLVRDERAEGSSIGVHDGFICGPPDFFPGWRHR